jgi:hypothetical protein
MESVFREALAHHNAGRLEDAEALYRRAAGWRPSWTLGNLGIILRTTGRLEEAEAVLRRALADEPGSAPIRHSLGMTLLQLGQYVEGWRCYEARHELTPLPAVPLPRWRGESVAGKRVLVVAEQGFGDQMLLARFIPLLAERAAEVIVAAPRVLVRLFEPLPAQVYNPVSWDAVDGDLWTPMGDVPRWLEVGPADAATPPVLGPPAATDPHGLGLMLEGAALNANNARRLPPDNVARAIRGLAPFVDLSPAATGVKDFADTAAIVAGLERVVTVDTSVAHLAGSMGKPCWVLLPRVAIDWYTSRTDDRSPWYPSVRLLRQPEPGNWARVISDLAAVLDAPIPEGVRRR